MRGTSHHHSPLVTRRSPLATRLSSLRLLPFTPAHPTHPTSNRPVIERTRSSAAVVVRANTETAASPRAPTISPHALLGNALHVRRVRRLTPAVPRGRMSASSALRLVEAERKNHTPAHQSQPTSHQSVTIFPSSTPAPPPPPRAGGREKARQRAHRVLLARLRQDWATRRSTAWLVMSALPGQKRSMA